MKRKLLVLLAIMAVTCWAAVAAADIVTYQLTTGNSAISGYTGPYATVSVNLTTSTTATITFSSLTNSGNIYLLGDGGSVGLNVNGAVTVSNITGSNIGTGFTPGPFSLGGAGNEDGFGSFNFTINSFDGYGHSSSTITFTLTKTSGTWASASNVLAPNANGWVAAAHIFVTTLPANAGSNGGNALATGYAVNGPPVPIPPTALLLGSGLLGIIALGVRRRKE